MLDRFPVPTLAPSCWRPAADVYRTAGGWLIKIELAGVHPADVTVSVEGCELTVTGQRRDQVMETAGRCQSLEIAYDRFERTFGFPCPLDAAGVRIRFEHGMLLVEVPNCPSARGSDAA